MLTFAVIASAKDHALPEGFERRLVDEAGRLRLHGPETSLVWKSTDGRVAVGCWEASQAKFGSGSWTLHEGGLAAVANTGWHQGTSTSAPSLLTADRLKTLTDGDAGSPKSVRETTTGPIAMIRVDAKGRGWVATDDMGTGHVYRAVAGDVVVLASDPESAARLATGETAPARDAEAMTWMAHSSQMFGRATSVSGVTVLPAASWVDLTDPLVIRQDPAPWEEGRDIDATVEELVDRAGDELVRAVQAVAAAPFPDRVLSLSGGRDSRVLLAAAMAGGVADAFRYRTSGVSGAADREVAVLLGDVAGVSVEVVEPAPPSLTPRQVMRRVYRHVHQTAGMFGAFDLKGTATDVASVQITGLFGELMRSHYRQDPSVASRGDALASIERHVRLGREGLLRPEVAIRRGQEVSSWVDNRLEAGWMPQDLTDLFYAEHRIGRWVGAASGANALNPTANPLATRGCVIAGFATPRERRETDELPYRLIARLAPSLLEVPLASASWHPRVVELHPHPLPPPMPHQPATGSGAWQVDMFSSLRPMFVAGLCNPEGAMYEFLDPDKTLQHVNGYGSLDAFLGTELWAALAAAIWLDRHETAWTMTESPSPSRAALPDALATVGTHPPASVRADAAPDPNLSRKSVKLALALADRSRPAVQALGRIRERLGRSKRTN